MILGRPELLAAVHDPAAFECGRPTIDRWLQSRALHDQVERKAVTLVSCSNDQVVGFCTVARTHVELVRLPFESADSPPVVQAVHVISRLATHKDHQGRGVASGLLWHVLRRIALRWGLTSQLEAAVLVQSLDERSDLYWRSWGFRSLGLDAKFLYRPTKDIAATVRMRARSEPAA